MVEKRGEGSKGRALRLVEKRKKECLPVFFGVFHREKPVQKFLFFPFSPKFMQGGAKHSSKKCFLLRCGNLFHFSLTPFPHLFP
jgi:hypothetical protein